MHSNTQASPKFRVGTIGAIARPVSRRKLLGGALFGLASGLWCRENELFASVEQRSHAALVDPRHEVLMMRHADAPGFSDPDSMRLDDCSTQRNLGERGRQQAAETGDWLRAQGMQRMHVWSSPWCRCKDTAQLLGFGEPLLKDFLGSFFRDRNKADPYTQALTRALESWFATNARQPLMLVTHQVNIAAYSGKSVSSGELLKIRVTSKGRPERVQTLRA